MSEHGHSSVNPAEVGVYPPSAWRLTEAQRAIWGRMTDGQRQRVIDAAWERTTNRYGSSWGSWAVPGCGCPLGIALPECGVGNPGGTLVSVVLSEWIDLAALDARADLDIDRFQRLYEAELSTIALEARRFADYWDHGLIPPAALVADLRRMQAVPR